MTTTPTPLAEGGDPGEFSADQVNDYLASLDPDNSASDAAEYTRVLAAERDGKARVTVLGKADENGNRPTDTATAAVPHEPPPTAADAEAAATVGGETVDLVLLQHWTDSNGDAHAPGQTVTVPAATAVTLLTARWARKPGDDTEGDNA